MITWGSGGEESIPRRGEQEGIDTLTDWLTYSMTNPSWPASLEIRSLVIGAHKFLQGWREKNSVQYLERLRKLTKFPWMGKY